MIVPQKCRMHMLCLYYFVSASKNQKFLEVRHELVECCEHEMLNAKLQMTSTKFPDLIPDSDLLRFCEKDLEEIQKAYATNSGVPQLAVAAASTETKLETESEANDAEASVLEVFWKSKLPLNDLLYYLKYLQQHGRRTTKSIREIQRKFRLVLEDASDLQTVLDQRRLRESQAERKREIVQIPPVNVEKVKQLFRNQQQQERENKNKPKSTIEQQTISLSRTSTGQNDVLMNSRISDLIWDRKSSDRFRNWIMTFFKGSSSLSSKKQMQEERDD